MENFKVEGRYLELSYEFWAFIRCMKVAFYRRDYQKFLMCLLIKRLGRAFVSNHAAGSFKRSVELLKHSAGFLRIHGKLKARRRVWKARPSVCIITRPVLSQSATVIDTFWSCRLFKGVFKFFQKIFRKSSLMEFLLANCKYSNYSLQL